MGAVLVDTPHVLIQRAEACVLLERGALITVRRAPFDGPQLHELRAAIDRVAPDHPRGLVSLVTIRLSPAFPLQPGFDGNIAELAETARAIDRAVVAHATVVELIGVRAAAFRVASRAVWRLARPRAELGLFERLTDAIAWLTPHARAVGAPEDPAVYVRCHREAERLLGPDDLARDRPR